MFIFLYFILGIRFIYLHYIFINGIEEYGFLNQYLLSMLLYILIISFISGIEEYKKTNGSKIENILSLLPKVILTNFLKVIGIFVGELILYKIVLNPISTILASNANLLFIILYHGVEFIELLLKYIIIPVVIIYYSILNSRKIYIDINKVLNLNEKRNKKQVEKQKLKKSKEDKLKSEFDEKYRDLIDEIYSPKCKYPSHYKTDTMYLFNDCFVLNSYKAQKIWVDNKEKLRYYEKSLKKLNLEFNGDYQSYIQNLINRSSKVSNKLSNLSQEFDTIHNFLINYKYKVNAFKKYIESRENYIKDDYKGCKAGLDGESRVNKELSLYTNIINLKNIRLEVADNDNNIQSIESDNILLTRRGIFLLEVKNFGEIGNYDIIIEKDGRWIRKNRSTGDKKALKNITKQNNRHIGLLNKFINEGINRDFDNYIEVNGIIVIANEKISIKNYTENEKVFRDSELYSYINKQPITLTKEELDRIKKLLLNNNLKSKKYPIYNYNKEVINNIYRFEEFVVKCENIIEDLNNHHRKYLNEKTSIYTS